MANRTRPPGEEELPAEAPVEEAPTDEPTDQDVANAQEEALGAAAPEADEPLRPATVNSVAAALVSAVDGLSGGQIETPEPADLQVDAPIEQLPPGIYAPLLTISTFLDEAGISEAEKHQFDPAALAVTNKGLDELTGRLNRLGRDKSLAKAVQQQAPAEEAPAEEAPEEPASEEDELEGLV